MQHKLEQLQAQIDMLAMCLSNSLMFNLPRTYEDPKLDQLVAQAKARIDERESFQSAKLTANLLREQLNTIYDKYPSLER